MTEQPLYTETHKSYWSLLWIVAVPFIGYALILLQVGTPELLGDLWEIRLPLAITLTLGGIGLALVFVSSLKNRIDFYPDRVESITGKKKRVIRFKEIKRVWKGPYHVRSRRQAGCFTVDYPGLRYTTPNQPIEKSLERRPAEIFVWNPMTSALGWSQVKDTPLIFELHNREKVMIVHVHDEKKALETLKKYTDWIEFSPVFDPMTRESIRGPVISN